MADLKKLRKEWKHALDDVWDEWNTPVWREGGPFFNLEDHPELDDNPGYNHLVGWVLGVSQSTGWNVLGYGKRKRAEHPPTELDLRKVSKEFDKLRKDVWEKYDDRDGGGKRESPFFNLEDYPELDENPDFNYEVGWLLGVSQVTGWPIDRISGPREWSPRW